MFSRLVRRLCFPSITLVLLVSTGGMARGELMPFTAALEIGVSLGQDIGWSGMFSSTHSGVASVENGVVRISAGVFSEPVPATGGFGGTLTNAAGSFWQGGAGPPISCDIGTDNACIGGGGFGGGMALLGIEQNGQTLPVLGVGGTVQGTTSSGAVRIVRGAPWTTGVAEAWFYVWELDPATPFTVHQSGSFRGLPSTFTGAGPAGFTVVTPVVVTSTSTPYSSWNNVRGVARLRIDFQEGPPSVPALGTGLLALLLWGYGSLRLARSK